MWPCGGGGGKVCELAPGPETFLTFRGELSRSLAVWSMAGYVLGIGDRHLDNFLLDTRSGSIVSRSNNGRRRLPARARE